MNKLLIRLCGREAANNIPPFPVTLTFDLLTLKVVSDSRVTWATSVPILVFLGLSVLDLGPMYATDVRQHHRLMPRLGGGGITTVVNFDLNFAIRMRADIDTRDHFKMFHEVFQTFCPINRIHTTT